MVAEFHTQQANNYYINLTFYSCIIITFLHETNQLQESTTVLCFVPRLLSGGLHTLATHVLQFMFLGYKGFKWPVCYYGTTEAVAAELKVLVWQVVNVVQSYGFKVTYISLQTKSFQDS